MKMHLVLELFIPGEPEEGASVTTFYQEVVKDFELPFVPYPGLSIALPYVGEAEDPELYANGMPEDSLEAIYDVMGIITVHDVTYRLQLDEFKIRAKEAVSDSRELAAAVTQYVSNYGFTLDGPFDDNDEDEEE